MKKAQAIASHLLESLESRPPADLAFLVFEDTVYYAFYSRKIHEPSSAILRLIQGIYEIAPKTARLLLRQRIYSTAATTELCHGAIKVAAKRIHPALSPLSAPAEIQGLQWINAGTVAIPSIPLPSTHPLSFWKKAEAPHSSQDFLDLAATLAAQISREGPLYRCDRAVAGLLVSKEGEILSSATNSNHSNRTFHAELNLIQDFYARTQTPIPEGSKLFVTLKPCKMCAGALWVAAQNPYSIEVYFSEFDSGRNARWTILDVGSAERKTAARNILELQAVLQHHVPPYCKQVETKSCQK